MLGMIERIFKYPETASMVVMGCIVGLWYHSWDQAHEALAKDSDLAKYATNQHVETTAISITRTLKIQTCLLKNIELDLVRKDVKRLELLDEKTATDKGMLIDLYNRVNDKERKRNLVCN